VAAILALASSVLWGSADFLGGTMARRVAPLAVVGGSQAVAFVLLVPFTILVGAWDDPTGYLPWAIAAGVVGFLALGAFYAALAVGTMGVVAPVAATGVVVPVAVGLLSGERPGAAAYVGIVVAVLGVVLASGPEVRAVEQHEARGGWRALVLAGIAAVGFGLVLVLVAGGAESSVPMTLLVQRATSVVVVLGLVVVLRRRGGLTRRDLPMLAAIGVLDVAANGTYALASTTGLLAVVAVLGSLYPVVTAALARIVHGERLQRVQLVGVVLALAGVALIAFGDAG
jgi:drug/metabolite transporter (DMT)-like permease